jgi:hypothetical protein
MTPGRINLKIVSDRLALARRHLADLETLRAMAADATRLAQETEGHAGPGS